MTFPKHLSLETSRRLSRFARASGIQENWHEPGEIRVRVVGRTLNNAMGDDLLEDGSPQVEKLLLLTNERGEQVSVNLASVLALAASVVRNTAGPEGCLFWDQEFVDRATGGKDE